jgi:hypothetical protein
MKYLYVMKLIIFELCKTGCRERDSVSCESGGMSQCFLHFHVTWLKCGVKNAHRNLLIGISMAVLFLWT